jgi:chemotaxis protein MotB
VKSLARKKQDSGGGGGNAPWLNTFADLMNLLLCFFVLLFAYSTVNEEKFQDISISMSNSFGVFAAGGSSLGEGELISSGMSQLNELDQFFNNMGKSTEGQTEATNSMNSGQGVNGASESNNVMDNSQIVEGSEGSQETGQNQGSENSDQTDNSNTGINEALDKIKDEMKKDTSEMYDQTSDLIDQYSLGDYVELTADPNYQYVELTLKGSVLFDSGDAELKETAKPILNRVGEILKQFSEYRVEITGHTDNVPMNSSEYKDNNWLSSARALNAAEFLIDNCDINPDCLKYSGRGEYEPIASNATAEGRAKNRRIEIRIYNQYSGQ